MALLDAEAASAPAAPAQLAETNHLRQLLEAAAALGLRTEAQLSTVAEAELLIATVSDKPEWQAAMPKLFEFVDQVKLRLEGQLAGVAALEDELVGELIQRSENGPVLEGPKTQNPSRSRSATTGRFEVGPDGPAAQRPLPVQRTHRSPITRPGYRKGQPPATKGKRREPDPFTKEEVLAMVRQTSRRGHGGSRDRALIVVLWRTGLRISEALDLKIRDLDLEHGFIRVRHGKGDKPGLSVIDRYALDVLTAWLERRAVIPGIGPSGYVFCTISQPDSGGRMGAPQFRSKLKVLAKRAGLDRDLADVYPHQFRHTAATDLALEGYSLPVIKEQLRHEHITTTERYVGRCAPTRLLEELQQRPEFKI